MAKKATSGAGGGEAEAPVGKQIFGVFQKRRGSYTVAGKHFLPLAVTPCGEAIAARPAAKGKVLFFDSEEKAAADVTRLRAEFDSKRKPKQK